MYDRNNYVHLNTTKKMYKLFLKYKTTFNPIVWKKTPLKIMKHSILCFLFIFLDYVF